MKKLMSILFVGMMLTGVLGSAHAILTDVANTKLGGNGAPLTHSLNGFNAGNDWLESQEIIVPVTLAVGEKYRETLTISSRDNQLFKTGTTTFSVGDKFPGTKLAALGDIINGNNGGGNNAVPEPGMLALMALGLLGLGLGPWLRKIHTR